MDTDQRTVQANGITLAYRVWGPQDAPPVLLLHARGADGADWSQIAPALAAGPRRIYAPDLRGHGRSDWPGDYAYETMRDDVHAFLGALGIARADVVGHSSAPPSPTCSPSTARNWYSALCWRTCPRPSRWIRRARPPNVPTGSCRTTGR